MPPATNAAEYLAGLPADRRATIAAVRDVIVKNLPAGYVEMIDYGMLAWGIPLKTYPITYNGRALMYVALASQKRYCSLYMTCVYMDPKQAAAIKDAFTKAGLKLDMGKSCIRFQTKDGLPLTAIGKMVRSTSVKTLIRQYESARPPKK